MSRTISFVRGVQLLVNSRLGLMAAMLLASLLALATSPSPVNAAILTWTGTNNTALWSDPNWDSTPVPGTGDTAVFDAAAGIGGAVIDLGGGVTINTILFDTAGAVAYTLGSGAVGSQSLTLNGGGAVTMNSTVVNNELFNAALTLGTDATTQS